MNKEVHYPTFDTTPKDEVISVTGDRSYQAAMRLAKEDPTAKIVVMNFAKAFHAGGGVTQGSSAQEESLCRCSTLYPLIYTEGVVELFAYHVKRAIHMLTVAASKGADVLVLGAFGCGAFRNDPAVVARAYKVALQEFPKVFKKVEFAVYTNPDNDTNYKVFKSVLGE